MILQHKKGMHRKRIVYWMHNVIKTEYCGHSDEMKTAGIHTLCIDSSCFCLKDIDRKIPLWCCTRIRCRVHVWESAAASPIRDIACKAALYLL